MNQIKRIQTFLNEYKTKSSYLQYLGKDAYQYNVIKLGKLYQQASHHPYPKEYLNLED
jgi:hypothetical protein|tara:strand:- start:98 stop:271 length:174 start_codon:yes stop_codon:yes gene_type:complete